jgi:hypothetical protein
VDFRLICVPFGPYDEPEILPYAITPICSISADVRQRTRLEAAGKPVEAAITATARKLSTVLDAMLASHTDHRREVLASLQLDTFCHRACTSKGWVEPG